MTRYSALSLIITAVITLAPSVGQAEIVAWHASSGFLPSAPSIPPESRYLMDGVASFVSLQDGFMNVNDTSDPLRVGFSKTDIGPIALDDDWAFQIEVRMNSHSRPFFDYGATIGIDDEGNRVRMVITRDSVGFGHDEGVDFVDDLFFAMDTTNDFHTYRVVKTAAVVHLFADTFSAPVLSVPYDSFDSADGTKVWLMDTSNPGLADFDIRSFAFNASGTNVPEPSTGLLLVFASLAALRRRDRAVSRKRRIFLDGRQNA